MTTAAGRTLTVLTALAGSDDPLSISQLAARTKIARASLGRLLESLQASQAVAVDDAGRYRATLRVLEPAAAVLAQSRVRELSFPYMIELSSSVGYEVTLGLYEFPDVIFIESVFVIGNRVSSRLYYQSKALLVSHTGRIMVAFAPEPVQEALLAEAADHRDPANPVDGASLRRELSQIREDGYIAYDRNQEVGSPTLVAIPIFDRTEHAVAALTVTRSTALDAGFLHDVLPKAQDITNRISTELGSRRVGRAVGI